MLECFIFKSVILNEWKTYVSAPIYKFSMQYLPKIWPRGSLGWAGEWQWPLRLGGHQWELGQQGHFWCWAPDWFLSKDKVNMQYKFYLGKETLEMGTILIKIIKAWLLNEINVESTHLYPGTGEPWAGQVRVNGLFDFPSIPVRWVIPENLGIDPPMGSEINKSKTKSNVGMWVLELDK